jgi:hypothetical protein
MRNARTNLTLLLLVQERNQVEESGYRRRFYLLNFMVES